MTTVAQGQARALHAEGRTMAEVEAWTDQDWIDFQARYNASLGPRTDAAYRQDMAIRLGELTGELRRVL